MKQIKKLVFQLENSPLLTTGILESVKKKFIFNFGEQYTKTWTNLDQRNKHFGIRNSQSCSFITVHMTLVIIIE